MAWRNEPGETTFDALRQGLSQAADFVSPQGLDEPNLRPYFGQLRKLACAAN